MTDRNNLKKFEHITLKLTQKQLNIISLFVHSSTSRELISDWDMDAEEDGLEGEELDKAIANMHDYLRELDKLQEIIPGWNCTLQGEHFQSEAYDGIVYIDYSGNAYVRGKKIKKVDWGVLYDEFCINGPI